MSKCFLSRFIDGFLLTLSRRKSYNFNHRFLNGEDYLEVEMRRLLFLFLSLVLSQTAQAAGPAPDPVDGTTTPVASRYIFGGEDRIIQNDSDDSEEEHLIDPEDVVRTARDRQTLEDFIHRFIEEPNRHVDLWNSFAMHDQQYANFFQQHGNDGGYFLRAQEAYTNLLDTLKQHQEYLDGVIELGLHNNLEFGRRVQLYNTGLALYQFLNFGIPNNFFNFPDYSTNGFNPVDVHDRIYFSLKAIDEANQQEIDEYLHQEEYGM